MYRYFPRNSSPICLYLTSTYHWGSIKNPPFPFYHITILKMLFLFPNLRFTQKVIRVKMSIAIVGISVRGIVRFLVCKVSLSTFWQKRQVQSLFVCSLSLLGSISSMFLCAAFTLAYPKSTKSCFSWLSFLHFWDLHA